MGWRTMTIAPLALELDVLDSATADQGTADQLAYFSASVGGVHVNVWSGPGQDLAGWRARLVNRTPQPGAEEATTLCGRPAVKQEATLAPERATGAYRAPSGDIGHLAHEGFGSIRCR